MKYTIKTTTMKKVDLSSETQMAIQAYVKIKKLEQKRFEAERDLSCWVERIPKEEMYSYFEYTTQIDNK